MSITIRNTAIWLLALLVMLATVTSGTVKPAQASGGTSAAGIKPTPYSGNFVASDDQQVCYELAQLGLISEVTTDMRGFKVDVPNSNADSYVSTTLSADGKYLAWQSNGATVHGIVVKGATNFHAYNYVGTNLSSDSGLHSPMAKKNLPQISHYNVCYTPDPPKGDEGCTPGYWRNHADRWLGAAPGDDYDATFEVDLFNPNVTLGQAIKLGGSKDIINQLAVHSTAALLNAYGGVPNADGERVDYPYTVVQVKQMVQEAVANGTIEATKDKFDAANNLGCKLSGTKANPV